MPRRCVEISVMVEVGSGKEQVSQRAISKSKRLAAGPSFVASNGMLQSDLICALEGSSKCLLVALHGLGGVGKTRLVQALFDDGVGTNSLDPSLAIYTNIADTPDPQPIGLASNLIASGTRAPRPI